LSARANDFPLLGKGSANLPITETAVLTNGSVLLPFGMSQPVKVSDALVLDARLMGAAAQRSIAGQIEFWAGLGRALELLLRGDQVLALSRAGQAKPLSDCLRSADSAAGRRRVTDFLRSQPFPHYEPDPDSTGCLIRVESNGTRTTGRFINRKFVPLKTPKS
jgi:hypothetical protein